MSDFKTEVNGVTYICKRDGTSLTDGRSIGIGKVLVVRGFIQVNGKRYVLKEIGKSAFKKCGIKSIGIPSSIELIREECFYHCESLYEVAFESYSKLKEICSHAFSRCAINSIRIPGNVEVIGEECFYECEFLSEVTFEPGSRLREICSYAFSDCAIDSIRIPSNLEVIDEWCFSSCESIFELIFEPDSA
jgi:hypothetical protein